MDEEKVVREFCGMDLSIVPDENHEWLMSTADVAVGYGVSEDSIRQHKKTHLDEFQENKHYLTSVSIPHGGTDPLSEEVSERREQAIRHPNRHWKKPRTTDQTKSEIYSGLQRKNTLWTKRGVLRLGMFIRSERAKIFRDWVEDLAIGVIEAAFPADPRVIANLPKSKILQIAAESAQECERLEAENVELRPKAGFYDKVADAVGLHTMQEAAKILGTGPNKLFSALRERGILMRNGLPYQHHLDTNRFKVLERTYYRGEHPELYRRVYVTGRGMTWLHGLFAPLDRQLLPLN